MIKFKSVRYKNFLSTGNKVSEVRIDDTRTSLIIGTNGAGKSTFMDAISFGLFGKPFRKVKLDQMVNSINKKNCMVELEFETGGKKYLIKRGLRPAKFEIYVDGEMNDQMASARDSQDFLERYVLRMNEKAFRQIVVLGSGSFIPFMRLSAGDRRAIIEDLLDIQIFSLMNDIVKQRISDNGSRLIEVDHKIELLDQSIQLQEDHLKEIQENNEEAVNEKKAELKKAKKQIEGIKKEIEELQSKVQDYNPHKKKQRKLEEYKSKISSNQTHILGQIKLVNENSECPECTQEISEEHKNNVTGKLGKLAEEFADAITEIDVEANTLADRIDEIEDVLTRISEKNNSIMGINEYIMQIETGLLESAKKPKDDQVELTKSKDDLDEARTLKYDIQDQKHHLNTVQELLKDTGIKTIIIRNYLPLINQLINKYLSALNFYINFELDEAFNETIKSRGRDAFQYGSFSEGEKLRIDLALLFTWREVAKLKSSVATNLLVLDEIFDSSLDSTGVEDFLGILNSLGDDTHAFVISHKGDQIIDKFGRVISIQKDGNFSRIE